MKEKETAAYSRAALSPASLTDRPYDRWLETIRPPKDPQANMLWRVRMLAAAEKDPGLRIMLKDLCGRSWEFFFDGFLWTFDPRPEADPNHLPFVLWPFQTEFVGTLEEQLAAGADELVEKSRDMGVTWCILGWMLWRWRFAPAFKGHCGSRKAEFVDKRGDTASHFGALRYMLRRLPVWLLPDGFVFKFHAVQSRLINPNGGNAITGEATTPDFSRQGRYTAIFLDEFASVACDADVHQATSESTNCRLLVSTPKGIGNIFQRERDGGRVRVITLHWSRHPKKCNTTPEYLAARVAEGKARAEDQAAALPGCYVGTDGKPRSPWYDEKCAKENDPRVIATELDISYLGSGMAVLDLTQVRELERRIKLEERRVIRVERDGNLEIYREPQPKHRYLASVDTAKGTGRDWSVAEVWDEDGEQVAELQAQMPPDVLGPFAVQLAKRYNDAFLVIENDGIGIATCYAARDTGYKNLYYHRDFRDPNAAPGELGLATGKCRSYMVGLLMEAVRNGTLKPHSLRWIAECFVFEWVRADRAEARAGYHDDLLLATMFVLYARPFLPSKRRQTEPLPFMFGLDGRGMVG